MNQEFEESEEEADFIFYRPEKLKQKDIVDAEKAFSDSGMKSNPADEAKGKFGIQKDIKKDDKPIRYDEISKPEDSEHEELFLDIDSIELNIEDNPDFDESISEKIDPSGLRRVIRDTPIAELTLRKYEMPYEENKRELLKKFCLSLGLLQPGDSRDIVVDVLHVLMQARSEKKPLDSEEIRLLVIEERKKLSLPMLGIASSNVRRQIKRLRDIFVVEKIKNEYIITEFASLENIFHDKIEGYLLPSIILRMKEYLRAIDKKF